MLYTYFICSFVYLIVDVVSLHVSTWPTHRCKPCPLTDKETEIHLFGSCDDCAPEYERSDCTGTMTCTTCKIALYSTSNYSPTPEKHMPSITLENGTFGLIAVGMPVGISVMVGLFAYLYLAKVRQKSCQFLRPQSYNSDQTDDDPVSASVGGQTERINKEVETDKVENSDDETVKAAGEIVDAILEGVSAVQQEGPCFPDEEKTKCGVSTTAPLDKSVVDPVEAFQRKKAHLWTRHIAKDFASSLQSQINPHLLETVASPTEQKQVEEEAMNMAKFWMKQDSGVPYLQLRDLFVDYKEAQYISTVRQRAKDPAFVQGNSRE